jgi:hypothetical protein
MNQKLFVGAAALTTVAVAGYLYYKWVRNDHPTLELDTPSHDEAMERLEENLKSEDTNHG